MGEFGSGKSVGGCFAWPHNGTSNEIKLIHKLYAKRKWMKVIFIWGRIDLILDNLWICKIEKVFWWKFIE